MVDKKTDRELREMHANLEVVSKKDRIIYLSLVGVIKCLRTLSEMAADESNKPKSMA